jgi:hypothetical protein
MSRPESLPQVRILLHQHSLTRAFPPLHDLAYFLRRSIAQEHVNMVARDLARDNLQLVFRRNLSYQVAHTRRHLRSAFICGISALTPDAPSGRSSCAQVGSVARDQVARIFASPKGEGFPPSRRGH